MNKVKGKDVEEVRVRNLGVLIFCDEVPEVDEEVLLSIHPYISRNEVY